MRAFFVDLISIAIFNLLSTGFVHFILGLFIKNQKVHKICSSIYLIILIIAEFTMDYSKIAVVINAILAALAILILLLGNLNSDKEL